MYRLGIFILIFFYIGAFHAHAQSLGAEPLDVTVSPLYPQPYDTIAITPGSTLLDLSSSVVTITVNGKVIQKGSGTAPASFTVGPSGESDTITVTASVGGQSYDKTVVVRPSSVTLVMEPVSTTHPFYEGASLLAPEGRVRLTAIADIRSASGPIAAANLVYTWKAGNQVLTDQSGIGRSTLTATAPLRYRDTDVTVTVSSQDGSVASQGTVALSPIDPIMRIYHNGALIGPEFDTALPSTYAMSGDEDSFRAVPYFFATMPALSWSVNSVANGADPVITVRTTGQGEGNAVLSVTAEAPASYQSADAQTTIHYGADTSTNIFGL